MIVYHYTGLDTLEKMLKPCNKENQILNFRATQCNFLNDKMENVLGIFILAKCIAQIEAELEVPLNECICPFFSQESYGFVLQSMKSFNLNKLNTFTLSFCIHDDDLPMWMMYGNYGNGITLGIDQSKVNLDYKDGYFNHYEGECTYWTEEMQKMSNLDSMPELYDSIKDTYKMMTNPIMREGFSKTYSDMTPQEAEWNINLTLAINMASYCSIFNKEDRWRNEKEYRISVAGLGERVGFHPGRKDSSLKIPHLDVHIPIKALKSITIGSGCEPNAQDKVVQLLYNHKIDYKNIAIKLSDQPIQTF